MSDIAAHGPIDFVLLEFPGDIPLAECAAELEAILDTGAVALYDLVAVRKEADGTFSGLELDELDGSFSVFSGARSGLLADEDIAEAAEAMTPGTIAVLFVYENTWAANFVGAVYRAGGEMIASARIPAADVIEALEALES